MAEEKNYTLRNLEADDLFLVVKIINKIGIRKLKGCFSSPEVREAIAGAASGEEANANGEEANLSAVGMSVMLEIAGLVLENLPDCKNEIYDLLAKLSRMTREDIATLPSGTFTKMVMDVIRKDEFKDFFQDVFGSLK